MAVGAASAQVWFAPPQPGRLQRIVRVARRNPLGAAAFVILLLMTLMSVFAPIVTGGVDPYAISTSGRLQPPGPGHILGTDDLGRDVFTRIVYGGRISLWVGFISVGISQGIGATLGIVGAYKGGWADFAIQRVVDALFAFPTIILALAIVAVIGRGLIPVTVAVGIVSTPRVARIARAATMSVIAQPYLEATTCMGATSVRVILRHILPNIMAPLLVIGTAGFGGAILAEASLSFLGLGTPPPQPSWGTMLSGNAQLYARSAPYLAIFPGIAISLGVFGFNLLGDALRDIFDPRLRGS